MKEVRVALIKQELRQLLKSHNHTLEFKKLKVTQQSRGISQVPQIYKLKRMNQKNTSFQEFQLVGTISALV
jgi:hypothetical protein